MPTARILIRQGKVIFRIFRFETSSDGSLLVFLDRDPQASGMTIKTNGMRVPEARNAGQPKSSTKFTVHTSGEIHRELGGVRKSTIFIEPLHRLTALHPFGVVSIPRPDRLDVFDPARHTHATEAILDIPEQLSERIHFVLEVGPTPQSPQTFGFSLNYELYSIVARVIPLFPTPLPDELVEHFVSGMPRVGVFENRQADPASAELDFYRAVHSGAPPIFREASGAYVMLAAVPMRVTPRLEVQFDRADLRIEQIGFGKAVQPSHKVRFWICDRGGRNKVDDLRQHIVSAALDAEL